MKIVQAILTIDTENLPANFPDILKHEQEVVAAWREEGVLEHLFLRETKNGAVLLFKDLSEEQVQERMQQLPLYPLRRNIDYFSLIKQF
jgi:hypothetical protein